MAEVQKIIRSIGPDGKEVISNVVDQYTGEKLEFREIDYTPSIVDDIIFIKDTINNKHYKRVLKGGKANIKSFGALGGGNDDTIAIQKAFSLLGVAYFSLLFEYDTYNFSQNLTITSKNNIEINFNNATLFDVGKDITVLVGVSQVPTVVKTPVGITVTSCNNVQLINLKKDQVGGGGGPIQTSDETKRVPSLDFVNCNNLSINYCEFKGPVGPYIKNLPLGPAHTMRASYLRFMGCNVVNVLNNTVASGCGSGEIFSFVDCKYITWESCYHTQGASAVTIYSWGKVINCSWVTVRGHKVQTLSPGSFIDFIGTYFIMSDIVFDGNINSKLLDLTAEWDIPNGVIDNVNVSNCITSGRGITSAGGSVHVPSYKNIIIDNIKCRDGITGDATTLMGFENITDISFNNIRINNIRDIFTAEIPDAVRDKFNTYRFNNLTYNLDVTLAANVVIQEANGLTEFRNSIFNINSLTTLAILEPRDRYAIYSQLPLTSSRSIIRYIGCTINNAKINVKANVEYINCIFNNCAFTTNINSPVNYQINPSLLFKNCDFNYTDDVLISNTVNGNLFFLNTLSKLTMQNCKFRGKTTNTNGTAIITGLSTITGDIVIDNCFFDLIRVGAANPKYQGLFRINNKHAAKNVKVSNCTFSENMLYIASIEGDNIALPVGVINFTLLNNKFLSETNSPILASATDVSRINISLIDEEYSSGLNLGTTTNFASQIIRVNMTSVDVSPETLFSGGEGSTFQSSGANGYRYIKQSATGKTGWIRMLPYGVGTTALRPTSRPTSFYYYDTTIPGPIWWDGTNWKNAAGTIV